MIATCYPNTVMESHYDIGLLSFINTLVNLKTPKSWNTLVCLWFLMFITVLSFVTILVDKILACKFRLLMFWSVTVTYEQNVI